MDQSQFQSLREQARQIELQLRPCPSIPIERIPATLRELANCCQQIAIHQLEAGNPDGWIDLLDGVTRFGNVGAFTEARALIAKGRELLPRTPTMVKMQQELDKMQNWIGKMEEKGVCMGLRHTGSFAG